MSQPQVKVGIMNEQSIKFIFPSEYFVDGKPVKGEQLAEVKHWNLHQVTKPIILNCATLQSALISTGNVRKTSLFAVHYDSLSKTIR